MNPLNLYFYNRMADKIRKQSGSIKIIRIYMWLNANRNTVFAQAHKRRITKIDIKRLSVFKFHNERFVNIDSSRIWKTSPNIIKIRSLLPLFFRKVRGFQLIIHIILYTVFAKIIAKSHSIEPLYLFTVYI
ncbi:hypothetical protein SDC9_166106 [bioreactor metagenome]|uniref:Uncharacterized protein n=1 Tax=bioreactor metagenome TaxID=1076179 RepID=A0A645G3Z5_9ZZZZ